METSLSKHVTELSNLSYNKQCMHIAKKTNIYGTRWYYTSYIFWFDDYFFHKIDAHIIIYCKSTLQDEYLVTIPIKNNLKDMTTIIKINSQYHVNNKSLNIILLFTQRL